MQKKLPGENKTTNVVEGSLLGLLALLLGFSFSLSNSRYDKRQSLVIDEANAIGTAILRCDLYPDSVKTPLKLAIRDYLEARISYDDAGANRDSIRAAILATERAQKRLWKLVSDAAQFQENVVRTNQMVPALNEMFDIASTRLALLLAKVPDLVFYLLFTLCFTGSFLIGYSDVKHPEWGIVSSFLIMVGLSIYMILDLDRPRTGIINNEAIFQQISALRSMFNNP
ncbi:MAG: hypothetical protein WBP58_18140 [Chitinophagaceae bacterium]